MKRLAKCRTCGKDFEPCKRCYTNTGVFNWREMCCSPECGQQYLIAVEKARNPIAKLTKDSQDIAEEVKQNAKSISKSKNK